MQSEMSLTCVIRRQLALDDSSSKLVGLESALSSDLGPICVKGYFQTDNGAVERRTKLTASTNLNEPKNEKVKLPVFHQRRNRRGSLILTSSGTPKDVGTIRRPYDGENVLEPLSIQKLKISSTLCKRDLDFEAAISSIRVTMAPSEKKGSIADDKSKDTSDADDNNTIAPFPAVEDDEIDKHRYLNEEAEKNSQKKSSHNVHPDYLKRLKLERKALAEKNRQLKLEKKRLMLQKRLAKPKVKENKDEFFIPEPAPPPPPKPKEVESKPVKTILGFRYSQAIEEYYRGQLSNLGSFITLLKDTDDEIKDEIVNGWFVRNLGAKVLNLKARTLPSCNPVEIRLRRQQARRRQRDSTRSLLSIHRSLSRESAGSHALLRSHDSLTKLKTIEEGRNSRQSDVSVKSEGEHKLPLSYTDRAMLIDTTESTSVSLSQHRLPPLQMHAGEEICHGAVRSPTKSISLRLPSIVSEE